MRSLGIFVLIVAGILTGRRARTAGAAAARLRWASLGLAAAALGLALWSVVETAGEHRRRDPAPSPATSSGASARP